MFTNRNRKLLGIALVWVMIFGTIVIIGIIGVTQLLVSHQRSQVAEDHSIRAKHLADAGLNRSISILKRVTDPADAAYYDPAFPSLEGQALADYVTSTFAPLINGATGSQKIQLKGSDDGLYQFVSLIKKAKALYSIRSLGTYTGITRGTSVSRLIEADVAFLFDEPRFGGAIISDMPHLGDDSKGKKQAQLGDVVFDTKGLGSNTNIVVIGDILANGNVRVDDTPVDANTIDDYMLTQAGAEVNKELFGTEDEIPDYTEPGSEDQLFDFGRFIAATDAGAGTHYASLDAFVAAAVAGTVFKGITVVDVDPGQYFDIKKNKLQSPKLKEDPLGGKSKPGEFYVPGGVHAEGTLLFNIAPTFDAGGTTYPTPDLYKIFFETEISINPAPVDEMSAFLDAMQAYNDGYVVGGPNPAPPTPPSGYPIFTSADYTGPKPWEVDISGLGYENFSLEDDLPALMYNTGILDLHRTINISGVLYTPSFVEIEQKSTGQLQYMAGSIIAGGGIFIEDNKNGTGGTRTIVAYDPETLNELATSGVKLRTPTIVAWRDVTSEL